MKIFYPQFCKWKEDLFFEFDEYCLLVDVTFKTGEPIEEMK